MLRNPRLVRSGPIIILEYGVKDFRNLLYTQRAPLQYWWHSFFQGDPSFCTNRGYLYLQVETIFLQDLKVETMVFGPYENSKLFPYTFNTFYGGEQGGEGKSG